MRAALDVSPPSGKALAFYILCHDVANMFLHGRKSFRIVSLLLRKHGLLAIHLVPYGSAQGHFSTRTAPPRGKYAFGLKEELLNDSGEN